MTRTEHESRYPLFMSLGVVLFLIEAVTGAPLHHLPLASREYSLELSISNRNPVYDQAATESQAVFVRPARSSIPHRFQVQYLREQMDENDDIVELYRRKGHPAPAHAAAPARSKPPAPPPAKHDKKPPPPPPSGQAPPKKKSIGEKIKEHFQHFKENAKKFFHKVGEAFKTVGLKIAKFAVKAVSVVHTWVGKAVGLVCKPLGKAIELGAKAEGAVADKLNDLDHHQSEKERKAFHGLDVAAHPMEYAAKAMVKKAEQSGKGVAAAKAGGAILSAIL